MATVLACGTYQRLDRRRNRGAAHAAPVFHDHDLATQIDANRVEIRVILSEDFWLGAYVINLVVGETIALLGAACLQARDVARNALCRPDWRRACDRHAHRVLPVFTHVLARVGPEFSAERARRLRSRVRCLARADH